jgi:hypothetical protein
MPGSLPAGTLVVDNNPTYKAIDTRNGFSLESKDSLLSLESVAMAALEAGTILMEAGASAKSDEGIAQMIAHGLRAERVDLRVGYASLAISVGIDHARITRIHQAGGTRREPTAHPGTLVFSETSGWRSVHRRADTP